MKLTKPLRILPLWAMLLTFPVVSLLPQVPTTHAQRSQAGLLLKEGQPIQLRLADDLKSNGSRVGQQVRFFTNQEVRGNNGRVLIAKGARAGGRVTQAQRAHRLGRKGVLKFTVDYVLAVDGTRVPLRTAQTVSSNNTKRGGAIVAAAILLSPAALLIRGRNINVKQGTLFTAFIDRRAQIRPQT